MIPHQRLFVDVQNCNDVVYNYNYVVAMAVDGEMWYYGCYDSEERAIEVAKEVSGVVLLTQFDDAPTVETDSL